LVKQSSDDDAAHHKLPGRRAVQAEQTRQVILGAARRRFAAQGYAGTSLKDIAAEAGVSVQTMYDSIGSKAELLRRLADLIDTEAQIGDAARALAQSGDPRDLVRIPAIITRRIVERCGDIVRASLESSRTEAGLGDIAAEGGRRHRAGAARVAARLAELDALAEGVDASAAATTIAALADTRLALVLLDDHGLDFDQIEEWMATTIGQAVLRRRPARRHA
jgi:AcrR family transcriptional regulator